MIQNQDSSVRAFVARSLAPGSLEVPELTDAAWETLWVHARIHGLTPYLHERWREAGILDRIPEKVETRFLQARSQNLERNRRLLIELQELTVLLAQADIPVMVSKGLPLAHACYPDLGMRVLFDVDLFVPGEHYRRAVSVFQSAGYVAYTPASGVHLSSPPLWKPREYAWDAEGIFDPERPAFVELHTDPWNPCWHGFRLPVTLQLWSGTRAETVDGLALRVPSEENVLIQLAVHYACNALESVARLMHLLDIGLLLRQRGNLLDWEEILRRTSRSQLPAFCFLSLELARRTCACDLPADVYRALREKTPGGIIGWIDSEGCEAVHSMSMYRPDRSVVYALHWNMAPDWATKSRVLLFSIKAAWRQEGGLKRLRRFLGRMAQRLRHGIRARRPGPGKPR